MVVRIDTVAAVQNRGRVAGPVGPASGPDIVLAYPGNLGNAHQVEGPDRPFEIVDPVQPIPDEVLVFHGLVDDHAGHAAQ